MTKRQMSLQLGLMVGCALFAGCDSGPSARERSIDSVAGEGGANVAGDNGWAPGGSGGVGGAGATGSVSAFEPFEIAINQTVTVGAFETTLSTATVSPSASGYRLYADLVISFVARNLSDRMQSPVTAFQSGDHLLLDVDGVYFYGTPEADSSVPGLRTGVGQLQWSVNLDRVTLDALRTAVITIGHADQNQVLIPLNDPSATVGLNDIDLDASFAINGFRRCTLDVSSARLQFSSHNNNELLPIGTALLVMEAVLSGDVELGAGHEIWVNDHLFLEPPGRISIAPESLSAAIYRGDRKPITLVFKLDAPYAGTYTFGVQAQGETTVTHAIVVP